MCRCIATWKTDTAVDSSHNRVPVTCEEVRGLLIDTIAALSANTQPDVLYRLAREHPEVYGMFMEHLTKRAEKTPASSK